MTKLSGSRERRHDGFKDGVTSFNRWILAALVVSFVGCKKGSHSTTSDAGTIAAAPNRQADSSVSNTAASLPESAVRRPVPLRPRTHAHGIEIKSIVPASQLFVGSTPGDEGRDPTIEPAFLPVSVSPYEIDALPYPNDPAKPPRTQVTHAEAMSLCAARGQRLCSEIEWEIACGGPSRDVYATGPSWDPACEREPSTCTSEYGVRAMGFLREWTSSTLGPNIAIRGAGMAPDAGDRSGAHRCARRTKSVDTNHAIDLGFRCCKGAPNAASIGTIPMPPAFRKTKLDAAQVGAIFGTIPELARVGTEIRFFEQGDVKNLINRSRAAHEGIVFSPEPLLWGPEAGVEVLVVTGKGRSMSFIVALYPLLEGRYRLASYFLFQTDLTPVALAYDPHRRKELIWSSCWGCAGEQGSVRLRDDHHIVIVQN